MINLDYLKKKYAFLCRIDNKIDWEMEDAKEYNHSEDFTKLSNMRREVDKEFDILSNFCEDYNLTLNDLHDSKYLNTFSPDRFIPASEYLEKYKRDGFDETKAIVKEEECEI